MWGTLSEDFLGSPTYTSGQDEVKVPPTHIWTRPRWISRSWTLADRRTYATWWTQYPSKIINAWPSRLVSTYCTKKIIANIAISKKNPQISTNMTNALGAISCKNHTKYRNHIFAHNAKFDGSFGYIPILRLITVFPCPAPALLFVVKNTNYKAGEWTWNACSVIYVP